MYAYPGHVSPRLIEVMASDPRICHYLDIPLQHGHPDVLRRMFRPSNMDELLETFARMRAAMPDMAFRSTFIVGYPGETEAEFQGLLDFVAGDPVRQGRRLHLQPGAGHAGVRHAGPGGGGGQGRAPRPR